jgi:CubicO group peptidase (beta-lactamase class C family)
VRLRVGVRACAFLFLATASRAEGDLDVAVRRIVEEERERAGTPALTVAVVQHGRVVAAVASGLADVEAGRAATLDTPFPAASVSKLLTAVLVMRQVERGALALDAPANQYLAPERWIRDAGGAPVPATLRQLLSHHAGLPVAWGGMTEPGHRVPTLEEHLAGGLRTIRPPGRYLIYSNDGFALAGFIAAQAEHETFAAHAARVLFEPLGMTRSTFASAWSVPDLAAPYGTFFGGKGRSEPLDTTADGPAASLVTTAPDLARFARMLLAGGTFDGARLLEPASVAQLMRLGARAHPALDEGFGLGFGVRERPGWKLAWWDGSLPGVAARFALLPEYGAGVVVLANLSDNGPTSVAARRILERIVPPAPEPPYAPSAAELAALAGSYRPRDLVPPTLGILGLAVALEFEPHDGTLAQRSRLTGESDLVPLGPRRFRLVGSMLDGATVLFEGDTVYVGFVRAERIGGWQTPRALVAYAGFAAGALLVLVALFVRSRLRRRR